VTVSVPQTVQATRRLTQTEAIVEAIAQEMRRDPSVFMIGQDIGEFGGSLQGTQGLWQEFGPRRIREAPISESAMVGAAIGAALFGRRPIVEVSFGEFLPAAMNQLINQAPNLHYMTGGAASVPVVIRTRVGDGPAFLSLDVDFVDAAFCPGTGTPEVGGPTSFQALSYLRALVGLPFVGFDVVEVSPPYDGPGQVTALFAANVIFEMLSLVVLSRTADTRPAPSL